MLFLSSILPYVIIIGLALTSFLLKKLTRWASVLAIFVAVAIYLGCGAAGLEMLGAFFVLGVLATSWHKRDKENLRSANDRGNRRNLWQVLANGGVAAACGTLAITTTDLYFFDYPLYTLMLAGSLAAAAADTLSSELGMVYGRRFYNIINFKPDEKGLDGVVSLEGTLIGVIGAAVIALVYSLNYKFSHDFWIIVAAGTIGNYVDLILGATVERKQYLSNNGVNLLNTMTGASAALVLYLLFAENLF